MPDEEELRTLDLKLKQLKLDYDRYFLGSRPREPVVLRGEVEKLVAIYSNQAITNSALRFRFSSLCSRYQAMKRQWCEVLRQMEQGTYARHRFRAQLHERERSEAEAAPAPPAASAAVPSPFACLFEEYRSALASCGQEHASLTPEKLERALAQQRQVLRERFGDAEFRFRVAIENGRAKLKAVRSAAGA